MLQQICRKPKVSHSKKSLINHMMSSNRTDLSHVYFNSHGDVNVGLLQIHEYQCHVMSLKDIMSH